jgi:hypothetical protein
MKPEFLTVSMVVEFLAHKQRIVCLFKQKLVNNV